MDEKHPNLLSSVKPKLPEHVIVCDTNSLVCDEGIDYLSLVTDACSRKTMGYEMKVCDKVKAFEQTIGQRQTSNPLIYHSGRDVQYCLHCINRYYNNTLSINDRWIECYQMH